MPRGQQSIGWSSQNSHSRVLVGLLALCAAECLLVCLPFVQQSDGWPTAIGAASVIGPLASVVASRLVVCLSLLQQRLHALFAIAECMWVDLSTIGVAGLFGWFACSLATELRVLVVQ